MKEKLQLTLSGDEIAQASYFPADQLKGYPDTDWPAKYLLPAVRQLAHNMDHKFQQIAVTFWCGVRRTARHSEGAIFVHVTPDGLEPR